MSLYEGLNLDDNDYRKTICDERMEMRKKIKTELNKSIYKVRNENYSDAEKPVIYLISNAIYGGYSFMLFCQRKDWDGLRSCELHNLNSYYTALYTPGAPKLIIDTLLKQKNKIEDHIMTEV
ncbi:hypothetical protein [Christiangramia echinicola]|uniref:hypothetical protein n=1 Tax=Christiangramia echinicola TaxID=279359 RepID=UPI000423BAC4|nr:hypothetical protein [Christiangramia echinicola]